MIDLKPNLEEHSVSALPRILFFNMNGSGMGHLNRCLAYARRLRGRAQPFFFSLASAIEIIEEMGFEADYFVSHYWTSNSTFAWNSELAVRFGLVLERIHPAVIVFDGTWPFQGFLAACEAYGSPAMVWSNRGLFKEGATLVPVDENLFDLVIQPGELRGASGESMLAGGNKRIIVPPVFLLEDNELLSRNKARKSLGLSQGGKLALFSLGAGNINDLTGIVPGLIQRLDLAGFSIIWARNPISVNDVPLPDYIRPVSVYPLIRYMHAFDVFIGAAGYNTSCEVVQSQTPSLLIPNSSTTLDDQYRRAHMVADLAPAVVSACETEIERREAVDQLLSIVEFRVERQINPILMNGASLVADEILALAARRGRH